MKFSALGLVFVLICGTSLQADDKPAAQPDQEALEKMMMEMGKPGPHHEYFKKLVGDWKTRSMDYTKGGDEPVVTMGTASFELLFDGRYLRQHFKSEYYGMPYEGIGTGAYDNAQQKYVGTWIDNFSTGMMHTEGKLDKESGTMTEHGKVTTPAGEMKFRMVTKHPSDDQIVFTMYMIGPDDEETKHMTIEYTRAE